MSKSESFPDLHHKMSKKIAQLTKVIYHLNTRNEDYEVEMKNLASKHESEMQEIMRDAADKLAKFKDAIAKQKDAAKTEAMIEKLKEQHEQEKKKAMKQLHELRKSVQSREEEIKTEASKQVEQLNGEVQRIKRDFWTKLEGFEGKKKLWDEDKAHLESQLKELKVSHQKEIDDLVKSSNKKYNDMLTERLDAEDALRKELEAAKSGAVEEVVKQYEAQMSALKEKHAGEVADSKEQFNSERQALSGQIEGLKSDLEAAANERSALEKQVNGLDNQLSDKRRVIEKLEADKRANEEKIADLSQTVESLKSSMGSNAEQGATGNPGAEERN